jgi:hypothetical protein
MDLQFVVIRPIDGSSEMYGGRHIAVRGALNADDVPEAVRGHCRPFDPNVDGVFYNPWVFDIAAQREEERVAWEIWHPPPKPDLRLADVLKLLGVTREQLTVAENHLGFPRGRWTQMSDGFGTPLGERYEVWEPDPVDKWIERHAFVFPPAPQATPSIAKRLGIGR